MKLYDCYPPLQCIQGGCVQNKFPTNKQTKKTRGFPVLLPLCKVHFFFPKPVINVNPGARASPNIILCLASIKQTNKKTTNQTENNPTKTSTNTFQPNLCKSLPRIKGKFFPSTPLPRGTLENCRFTVNEKVTYVYEPNPSSSSSSSVHYTSTHT